MYDLIVNILNKKGPLLSNELINELTILHAIKAGTARTRIKRAVDQKLISVSPVAFKNNSRLYFLKKQKIKNKVGKIMVENDSPESRVFSALASQNGFLYWDEFCKLTACSIEKINSKKSIKDVLNNLEKLEVVTVINEANIYNRYVMFSKDYSETFISKEDLESRKRGLNLNYTLLEDLMAWLERISIVGWNSKKVSKHGHLQEFNNYVFDGFGFAYILGLYKTQRDSSEKSGSPVLVDSVSHRATEIFDISSFIKRIENVYGPINQRDNPNFKILPIFFVSFIKPDAHKLAKQKGIIIISISEVFDRNILGIMKKMMTLSTEDLDLQSIESLLNKMEPDSLVDEKVYKDQEKLQGKLNNLKGIVFNFLVSYMFSNLGYPLINVGMHYEDNSERKCECDLVVSTQTKKIEIICEVKVRSKDNLIRLGENMDEEDSVKRFFERTHNIIQSRESINELFYIPIFITSSEFEQDAIEYMKKRCGKKMKAKLDSLNSKFPDKLFYGRNDLIELSMGIESGKEIRKILKNYF